MYKRQVPLCDFFQVSICCQNLPALLALGLAELQCCIFVQKIVVMPWGEVARVKSGTSGRTPAKALDRAWRADSHYPSRGAASPVPLEKRGQFTVEMPEWEEGRGLRLPPTARKATHKPRPVRPKVVNVAPFSLSNESL